MNYTDHIMTMESQQPIISKATDKDFERSLEYDMIASMAFKQFTNGRDISFDKLLSIPLMERIPTFTKGYGLKRTQGLVKTIVQQFVWSVPLPKAGKLTETKVETLACDLISHAYEDQLAIEDLIIFFEVARKNKYGPLKEPVTNSNLLQKFEQYRTERTKAYHQLKEIAEAQVKNMSSIPRVGDTRSIGELLKGGEVIDMNKKMSG